jgi:hypothetical protein
MPTRRNVLLGAGALLAGGGAVLGTGAFTTVQAERTINVETAGDGNAFLGLDTIDGSPNSDDFAEITDGTLEVTIDSVNLNAITHIDRVFQVTNNGSQPVVLYFEEQPGGDNPDGNAIDIGTHTNQLANTISVGGGDQPSEDGVADEDIVDLSRPQPPDSGNVGYGDIGVLLGVGDTLEVGIYIDTSDDNLNDGLGESGDATIGADELLLEQLVIYADATAAENSNYYVEAESS